MNRLVAFVLFLLCSTAEATQQTPELFTGPSGTRGMLADPLFAARESDPTLWARFAKVLPKQTCSALWRGYIGTWDISNGELRLLSIRTSDCKESKVVALPEVFPGAKGPVPATWYTGELLFEIGPYVPGPCGFSPTCPTEYEVIVIQKGKVIRNERRQHIR